MASTKENIKYWQDDGNFGPADLKDAKCPPALLAGYKQLGNGRLNKKEWLAKYKPGGKWYWPDDAGIKDGFASYGSGEPIMTEVEVGPGMLLDRFGGDGIAFFCAYGTPYSMRSLPGCVQLQTYEVYYIKKSFIVNAGTALPWFEQPRLCLQLKARDFQSTKELIDAGYLHRLDQQEKEICSMAILVGNLLVTMGNGCNYESGEG